MHTPSRFEFVLHVLPWRQLLLALWTFQAALCAFLHKEFSGSRAMDFAASRFLSHLFLIGIIARCIGSFLPRSLLLVPRRKAPV
jgi:hypothetical protein